ncbi:ABC transporter permease [Verminephrobacter aporrectodeae subsp. tuberculatae]|uniref:ABC transporter permease n=1 Tax=Verminephrobacter aporrectodeae TaxID=1110389 RepID=UPI002242F52F|nr:ABC transporter permease [Verminephrobacter aporrectodeae]MCW8165021.1 ABC transporter permease [Verminephrobacter aporrectodeae subsp. tuberculatae]MCW8168336.1 ABC transporter permease [Verminephrobacter aporrectodeae subsp. tuberculatae]MCW8199781.1 ABC transporter permease [Verminephrobacter aporrectodeae subsp. tuberculatae]MCW8208804.1 ABC transporter permease [Verminephrobacter aporrectodeae subsp. tuberculatae]
MLRFIAKRSAFMLLMLAGLLGITFTISHVAPGDPARLAAGPNATEAMVQTIRAEYGMDQPVLAQFGNYLGGVLRGDLGRSITTTRPVFQDLLRYFPATLELVCFAILMAIVGGLTLGTVAAATQNRWPDHLIRLLSTSGVAFPMFSLGLLLKYLFAQHMEWLPLGGRLDMLSTPPESITGFHTIDSLLSGDGETFASALRYMLLPALALAFPALASIVRVNRAEMLEVLCQDYIVAARAHGVAAWRVIAKYALRNAMLPTLAMIGLRFGWMLGGTVLVESVFDWPGIGLYAVQATMNSDFQPIMGVTLVLGASFMLTNFVIDVVYGMLDPRVRHPG